MDVDGFLEVLRGLRDGSIERRAIDTPEPSAFARGILSSQPYTFLDDAPLEERRTQAVMTRRILDPRTADELGALDAAAVARVRDEAWPRPESAEEVHEALGWMGYVACDRGRGPGRPGSTSSPSPAASSATATAGSRSKPTREPKAVLRGGSRRSGLSSSRPARTTKALLLQLEAEGSVLRARIDGRGAWCDRRLLARIHRYTSTACAGRSSR
jgi:ATP-dependent Lhr-like helicase